MDKLDQYRRCIQEVLTAYQQLHPANADEGVERQLLLDPDRDHYQVLKIGWRHGNEPVFGCIECKINMLRKNHILGLAEGFPNQSQQSWK